MQIQLFQRHMPFWLWLVKTEENRITGRVTGCTHHMSHNAPFGQRCCCFCDTVDVKAVGGGDKTQKCGDITTELFTPKEKAVSLYFLNTLNKHLL